MKRDVDILIFLEHLNRELDTALLLKILLSSRGYSVKLASVYFDLWESVATLRPDLLIVPWAYSEVKKYCRFFPQPEKGLRILNLHHEQLGVESYMESHMAPSGEAEKVFHLAWGGRFDRILRARGVPRNGSSGRETRGSIFSGRTCVPSLPTGRSSVNVTGLIPKRSGFSSSAIFPSYR